MIPNVAGSSNSPGIVFLIFREEEDDMTPDTPGEGGHIKGIHLSVKEILICRGDNIAHNSIWETGCESTMAPSSLGGGWGRLLGGR